MRGRTLHAPAHMDAEVLSALGRLQRAGEVTPRAVADALHELTSAPIVRHLLSPLLIESWARREDLRLVDALYVVLAAALDAPLLSTDARLARAVDLVELVEGS